MLIGQNVVDLHPERIKDLGKGHMVTSMKISLLDEKRFIGFAATFHTRFEPI